MFKQNIELYTMDQIIKNDKKTINGWALFDWANSAYALVISTAVFPPYFTGVLGDEITFAGIDAQSSTVYTLSITLAYLILALLSPLLSGMADYSGRRMFFLRVFTTIGSLACMALAFFNGISTMYIGVSAFIIATIGFAGSLVFYDSYLPLITTEDQYDRVSAKGFTYGYIGSVILLLFILMMIQFPNFFGITSPTLPAQIGFGLVGLWWLGFSQITFNRLPKDSSSSIALSSIKKGYKEIKQTFNKAKNQPSLFRFLIAFFLCMAGVQTVIYVATVFADIELGMGTGELIAIVLVIQLIGIVGAIFFAWFSNRTTNKKSLLTQICIWFFICLGAYLIQSKTPFYLLAAVVGLVMGGVQSMCRSSYSKLIPTDEDDVTSYFSFYDVVYKLAIVVGTFLFGMVNYFTGNMRYSVLVLAALFVGSFFVMRTVVIQPERELQASA